MMTPNDLDDGRLNCLVRVAPLQPAEFVSFRIGQQLAESHRLAARDDRRRVRCRRPPYNWRHGARSPSNSPSRRSPRCHPRESGSGPAPSRCTRRCWCWSISPISPAACSRCMRSRLIQGGGEEGRRREG